MFSSLGSHIDFPEHVLMTVFYRFTHNLEEASREKIKDREKYSSNLK